MPLHHLFELPRRRGKLAATEQRVTTAKREFRDEVASRQRTLYAMTLLAGPIDDERRRSPLGAKVLAQPLELVRIMAHVHAHGHEVLSYELRNMRIGIHLGIQPSTSRSHRCGAEVKQDISSVRLRTLQSLVERAHPLNGR